VRAVSAQLGVSTAALREWFRDPGRAVEQRRGSTCFACAGEPSPVPASYAYLLGQYLGDGHLVTSVPVPRLRIACADAYPNIAAAVDAAIHAVSGIA